MIGEMQRSSFLPRISGSRVTGGHATPPSNPKHIGTVMQVVRTYLPPTENWIYEQVRHVERYRSVFASKKASKPGLFPFDPVYCAARNPIAIQLFDRWLGSQRGYSPFFAEVATQEKAQIIHAHGGGIATFVVHVAKLLELPLVVSFYGTDMWNHPDGIAGLQRKYEETFRSGALCLAEGPAAAAQLARIGCPAERIVVHRLGVDVRAIPFRRRKLADGAALQVLMASRFVEKKGIPYGVEAFCRVARDNPRMALTIVGQSKSAKDRPLADQIRRIASRHGVASQVSIRPFMTRQQLRELAEHYHVLLHPSVQAASGDSEGGHPVVMTMLAATGMPIIATRHCDIPEIVRDGESGWLVGEKDPDALEHVLRRIVYDPACLTRFGESARRIVEAKYDIRSMRLDAVYDRVAQVTTSMTRSA